MTPTKTRQEFKIQGLDCAEEVAVLKREVGPVVGGEDRLGFDILNAEMIVRRSLDRDPAEGPRRVARTGMRAEPWRDDEDGLAAAGFWERKRRTILTATSGGVSARGEPRTSP